MTSPVPIIDLDYATDAVPLGDVLVLFRQSFWLAVLSGPCVASCFLVIAQWPFGTLVHAAVYAAILTLAVFHGRQLGRSAAAFAALRSPARGVLDLIAGVGLAIIGFAPLGRELWVAAASYPHGRSGYGYGPSSGWDSTEFGIIGFAFLLLTATTFRHVLLYRGLSGVLAAVGRPKLGRAMRRLGGTKFVYESIWLACCTLPLVGSQLHRSLRPFGIDDDLLIWPAFGALFGVPLFGILWVVMMVMHGNCVAAIRRTARLGPDAIYAEGRRPGFDVLVSQDETVEPRPSAVDVNVEPSP